MTLAHPMAVLPLRGSGLPMTALAIGSMVPDVGVFLRWYDGYELSHTLLGIVTLDLALGTALAAVWWLAVRDAVVDLAPAPVRSRLAPRSRPTARAWALTPVAVAAGAATHVLWDSFTHAGRWGPRHVDWLAAEHHGLAGVKWAQYTSGVLGLAVVALAVVLHLRALDPLPGPRRPRVLPAAVLPGVVVLALLGGVGAAARKSSYGVHDMAFDGVVRSVVVLAVFGAIACVAWHVVRVTRTVESRT